MSLSLRHKVLGVEFEFYASWPESEDREYDGTKFVGYRTRRSFQLSARQVRNDDGTYPEALRINNVDYVVSNVEYNNHTVQTGYMSIARAILQEGKYRTTILSAEATPAARQKIRDELDRLFRVLFVDNELTLAAVRLEQIRLEIKMKEGVIIKAEQELATRIGELEALRKFDFDEATKNERKFTRDS